LLSCVAALPPSAGTLVNCPLGILRLSPGDKIEFKHDHVIDIDWPGWESCHESSPGGDVRLSGNAADAD
jgi:hypothetical protein